MTIHAFDVTLRNTQLRERRIVNLMVIHILREQHTHDILLGSAVSNVNIKQHARAHINVTYENERTQRQYGLVSRGHALSHFLYRKLVRSVSVCIGGVLDGLGFMVHDMRLCG